MKTEKQIFKQMDYRGVRIDRVKCQAYINETEILLASVPADRVTATKRKVSKLRKILAGLDAVSYAHPEHQVREDVGRVYPKGFTYTNLDKEFRGMVLPDQNQKFWEVDAHAAEVATLAVLSRDEKLLQDCLTGDVYSQMASRFYGKRRVEADPKETRNRAKVAVLVILYNGVEGIPSEWARNYPVSAGWLTSLYEELLSATGGYIALSGFGTPREFEKGFNPRSVVSHMIQSTAAEAFRKVLPLVDEESESLGGRLVMTSFDSVVLSLPESVNPGSLVARMEEVLAGAGYPMKLKVKGPAATWS